MSLKVVTTISLLTLYYGGHVAYSQIINHPTSSQSLNSDDLPISYKIISLHNYPSHSPNYMPQTQQTNYYRQKYHAVQYAPLDQNAGEIKSSNLKQTATINNNAHFISKLDLNKYKTEHLEPRKLPTNNFDAPMYKPFILGHNVEVLQSVSRSPGHNTAYRSYREGSDRRHNKVNFIRNYVISQIPSEQTETTIQSTEIAGTTPTLQSQGFTLQLYLDKENNKPETYSILNEDSTLAEDMKPQQPYPKSHRLHLNVARVYGLGLMIPKTATNQKVIKKKSYIIKEQQPKYMEPQKENTFLYPIKHKTKLH